MLPYRNIIGELKNLKEGIWRLLQHYAIPATAVNMIASTYANFRAQVAHNNKLTEPFETQTAVKQGCLLSTSFPGGNGLDNKEIFDEQEN